jgi:hypothetical protein
MRRLDAALVGCDLSQPYRRVVAIESQRRVAAEKSGVKPLHSKVPMTQRKYNSFTEFWPHYVAEHSKPRTRLLHLIGTTVALACLVFFIVVGRWWLFPLALIPGYGAAWVGHFLIEKNKPATFQYPLWSFMGDYKMIWMMLTGRMAAEIERSRQQQRG